MESLNARLEAVRAAQNADLEERVRSIVLQQLEEEISSKRALVSQLNAELDQLVSNHESLAPAPAPSQEEQLTEDNTQEETQESTEPQTEEVQG